MNKVAPEVTGL